MLVTNEEKNGQDGKGKNGSSFFLFSPLGLASELWLSVGAGRRLSFFKYPFRGNLDKNSQGSGMHLQ